jgi:hypothetical protein
MLDDEQLIKYLGVVRMMEENNRQSEEQIKADDVKISAQGEQAANPQQAEQNPGMENILGSLVNQTNEVPNG